MTKHHAKPKYLPWLFAVVLLAVQALAFAHELQHDLHQHDDPSCVLHLYTKHAGHPSADVALIVVATPHATAASTERGEIVTAPVLGYRTRAPPLSSVRSI